MNTLAMTWKLRAAGLLPATAMCHNDEGLCWDAEGRVLKKAGRAWKAVVAVDVKCKGCTRVIKAVDERGLCGLCQARRG